jgi:hypothetical protein
MFVVGRPRGPQLGDDRWQPEVIEELARHLLALVDDRHPAKHAGHSHAAPGPADVCEHAFQQVGPVDPSALFLGASERWLRLVRRQYHTDAREPGRRGSESGGGAEEDGEQLRPPNRVSELRSAGRLAQQHARRGSRRAGGRSIRATGCAAWASCSACPGSIARRCCRAAPNRRPSSCHSLRGAMPSESSRRAVASSNQQPLRAGVACLSPFRRRFRSSPPSSVVPSKTVPSTATPGAES